MLESVPLPVVTVIVPVVAPAGTVALMSLPETTVKVADVPLKLTLVVPGKVVPQNIHDLSSSAGSQDLVRTNAPRPIEML